MDSFKREVERGGTAEHEAWLQPALFEAVAKLRPSLLQRQHRPVEPTGQVGGGVRVEEGVERVTAALGRLARQTNKSNGSSRSRQVIDTSLSLGLLRFRNLSQPQAQVEAAHVATEGEREAAGRDTQQGRMTVKSGQSFGQSMQERVDAIKQAFAAGASRVVGARAGQGQGREGAGREGSGREAGWRGGFAAVAPGEAGQRVAGGVQGRGSAAGREAAADERDEQGEEPDGGSRDSRDRQGAPTRVSTPAGAGGGQEEQQELEGVSLGSRSKRSAANVGALQEAGRGEEARIGSSEGMEMVEYDGEHVPEVQLPAGDQLFGNGAWEAMLCVLAVTALVAALSSSAFTRQLLSAACSRLLCSSSLCWRRWFARTN